MAFYSEEHKIFQASVRKFAEKELRPNIDRWETEAFFPSSIFRALGDQGFLGILVPEQDGGIGGDYQLAAAWCEEFGRTPSVGLTTGVNMHSLVITPTIARYGKPSVKSQWIPRALSGEAIGAYAFTEPSAGSDLSGLKTRAVRDGDSYLITGSKIFITNGKRAHFVLVLAQTDASERYGGFTTFLVDTSLPGFSVSRTLSKLGWHCSDTAELVFDHVRVPADCVIGEVGRGWYQAMESLNWERLMLTLGAIGGTRECLDETVRYINERTVFGKRISEFNQTRAHLTSLVARLESGTTLAHRCVELLCGGLPCQAEIALCKLKVCTLAIEIADYCLQLHGGYGYTTEFPPERWLRDLRLNTIGGGTNEIMAQIAVRSRGIRA